MNQSNQMKITTLYCRLSQDDGYSGASFNRPDFQRLLSDTEEMAQLKEKIPAQEAAIQSLREKVCSTDHFIALAKRYTDIQELTPELLRLFIRKIVVHEKNIKWSKYAQ